MLAGTGRPRSPGDLPLTQKCNAPANGIYSNIVLRNITIIDPLESPGVIIGSATQPIQNLVFEDVVVVNPPTDGWWGSSYYYCKGVGSATATGTTWPIPPCFQP